MSEASREVVWGGERVAAPSPLLSRCGFRVLDSRFFVSETLILDSSISIIPDSKAQDFRFHKQKISWIREPGLTYKGPKAMTRLFACYCFQTRKTLWNQRKPWDDGSVLLKIILYYTSTLSVTTSSPSFFLRDSRAREARARVFSLHAACRFFSRGVIFTRVRVSLALLSLRKNGGLLVV